MNLLQRFLDTILGGSLNNITRDTYVPYEYLGKLGSAAYAVNERDMKTDSVIYSLGVGEDTSWDEAMIHRYDVDIYAFDFTPRAIEHAKALDNDKFHLYPYGVAAKDGFLTFYKPFKEHKVSWSSLPRATSSQSFPVRRLSTIMRDLGHDHLDILKMDIEGAEYEVLDDMLASGIYPQQILVEFQHRFEGAGIHKTLRAIRKLRKVGYKIFFISGSKEEFSFIRA